MSAVDEILSGFLLPLLLFGVLLIIGLIRVISNTVTQSHSQHQRTISHNLQASFISDDSGAGGGNGVAPLLPSSSISHSRCCNNKCAIPSLSLAVFHTVVISYSAITKTTMSLLQCRQSPIDSSIMIMYMAGSPFPSPPFICSLPSSLRYLTYIDCLFV
jgi:hypothetical protein